MLPPDEIAALLAACKGDCYLAVRNRARIVVRNCSGLRIAAALLLYPKDVDEDRSSVRVLGGKGNNANPIQFSGAVVEPL